MRAATDATAAEAVDPLTLALGYAGAMRWHVFPCHTIRNGRCSCGKAACRDAGKHPVAFLAPSGLKNATIDEVLIQRWWGRSEWRDANIAIATGRISGLIVVDVDGEAGERMLAEFEREHGALPETTNALTGKGRHLYFLIDRDGPAIKCIANGCGLDIRGENGYVIAPPSVHASGRRYTLKGGGPVAITQETAAALREFIARHKPAKAEPAATPGAAASPLGPVPDHLRALALATKRSGLNEAARVVSAAPPETPQEVERIRSALSVVSAEYREPWLQVGMALHSTKWKSWRQIWDEWSRTSPDKFNEEGQNKAAESFERGYDGAKITLGTVFHMAKEKGWVDPTPVAPAPVTPTAPGAPAQMSGANGPPPAGAHGTPPVGPNGAAYSSPDIQDELVTICIADVEMKRVEWVWEKRLAIGKLTLVAGHPGLGKSLSLDAASRISRGAEWPCGEGRAPLGEVLILSAEDDVADTYGPRLLALGADTKRIHAITMVKVPPDPKRKGSLRGFDLGQDIERLERLASRLRPKLLIIDPVSAYMGGPKSGIDTHRNTDVRAILAPLKDAAERGGFAVLAITHLNKGSGSDALQRVTGSGAFVAAARMAFMVAKDETPGAPPDGNRRLFLPLKNNLARDVPGRAFTTIAKLVNETVGNQPVIQWENATVMLSADEVLAAKDQDGRRKPNPAVDFLRDFLADGKRDVRDIEERAEAEGITKKQLRSTREKIGIVVIKGSFKGGWAWKLSEPREPAGKPKLDEGCPIKPPIRRVEK